jgi:hypothetical protein
MYTADLPTSPTTTIATFADDTAVLATGSDPAVASQKIQTHIWSSLSLPSNDVYISVYFAL